MDSPLYIIGTERSGSNLLRLILNAHSNIHIPHPPHILNYFAPIEGNYGDLTNPANLQVLVQDVLGLVQAHIYPWDVPLEACAVCQAARPKDLMGVFAAIYEASLDQSGKGRWGCKSTFMVDHIDRILKRDPGAKLVWLVRDPRDVALSAKKSVFCHFHPANTVALWAREQQQAHEAQQRWGGAIVHRLHYEQLIADPRQTVMEVCSFLNEPFEEPMLQFFETADAQIGAGLSESWQNTRRPILTGNAEKWRKGLTTDEVAAIEAVAGAEMTRLGYQPVTLPDRLRIPNPVRRQLVEWRLRGQVEWRSLRHDANHWQRWKRDLYVSRIQRERLG